MSNAQSSQKMSKNLSITGLFFLAVALVVVIVSMRAGFSFVLPIGFALLGLACFAMAGLNTYSKQKKAAAPTQKKTVKKKPVVAPVAFENNQSTVETPEVQDQSALAQEPRVITDVDEFIKTLNEPLPTTEEKPLRKVREVYGNSEDILFDLTTSPVLVQDEDQDPLIYRQEQSEVMAAPVAQVEYAETYEQQVPEFWDPVEVPEPNYMRAPKVERELPEPLDVQHVGSAVQEDANVKAKQSLTLDDVLRRRA